MAGCTTCNKGLNSTYIRTGSSGLLKKIGSYCDDCNLHYDLGQKLYTVNEIPYTVSNYNGLDTSFYINLNSIYNTDVSCNNLNKNQSHLQNFNGPGRIRTNDPRHVKAVS